MEKQILQDFGEKIGGARKDLSAWRKKGLTVEALDTLNEREADLYVVKKNVYKKPDYEKIRDGGVPIEVVFFIKKVYDAIPAKPSVSKSASPEEKAELQKEYINTVYRIMDAVAACKTTDDCLKILPDVFIHEGWLSPPGGISRMYSWTDKGRRNPALQQKTAVAVLYRSENSFLNEMRRGIWRQHFLARTEENGTALPRGYRIVPYSRSSKDGGYESVYCVTYKSRIVDGLDSFATEEEARESLIAYAKEKEKASRKLKYVPPQLTSINRTGEDILSGKDVTGNDYLNTFNFRGGEYGNWMNEADRQVSMNMGYEALMDLASVLGIENEDIALNGELSIAFGARGSGNALAHYEPLRKVINLTKTKGAGCLAHEWWHALDDYIGTQFNVDGMASETLNDVGNDRRRRSDFPEMTALVRSLMYKTVHLTEEEAHEKAVKDTETIRDRYLNRMHVCLFNTRAFLNLDLSKKEEFDNIMKSFREHEGNADERLKEFYEKITGKESSKITSTLIEEAWSWCNAAVAERNVHHAPETETRLTQYFKDAQEIDSRYAKNGGYWQSITEMSARAFEAYVKDRLGYTSDYLCAHADATLKIQGKEPLEAHKVSIVPQGKEREDINANFDKVFEALRNMELLHARTAPFIKAKNTVEKAFPLPDDETSLRWIDTLKTEDAPLQIGMSHFFRITPEDIRSLALLHQAGFEREKIEDVLDVCCGYMTELSMLRAHDYDALVNRKSTTKKKAKQRAV